MCYIRILVLKNEQIAQFLFFNERCARIAQVASKMSDHERFAQVAHQKWATMSELLKSLTKKEQMSESLVFLANRSFAHFFAKN